MKIVPKAAVPTPDSTPKPTSRDIAIAKLNAAMIANAPQQAIVENPTSVSPEEMGAIRAPSSVSETPSEGQPVISEESKDSSEVTKTPEEPLSSQFAVLARKEKALRAKVQAQEAAIKQREELLRLKEESIKSKEAEYASKYISKDKLTQDTLTALGEAGLSYDDITQLMLNQPSPEKAAETQYLKKLEAKIAALENGQNETKKSFEEQQQQSYKQAVEQIKSETKNLVISDSNFEMIRETNSVDDVVELIEATFKEDGILMTVQEAAQAVEDHLLEEALKIARIKKLQSRLNPVKAEAPKSPETPQKSIKTLTNSVASQRTLTARERALLAFKGELK